MVLGIGNKCAKYLVFIFNFLVFVVGIAILAVSLTVLFNNDARKYFQKILDDGGASVSLDQMYIPLYVLAAVGALLLLTGFLGCCGACTENVCLLSLFFAIILILFVAELACGIAVLVAKDKVKQTVFNSVTAQIRNYDQLSPDDKKAIDEMQQDLKCCGCNNSKDYQGQIPQSCGPTPAYYDVGCCNLVWNDLESKATLVGGIALGILIIEALAMIFSCILCHAFRRGDYHYA